MKKKMLAVLLAGAMVASLTACGGSNSADTAELPKLRRAEIALRLLTPKMLLSSK